MRPPATDGVAYPLPRSLTCHRSFGPSLGHSLRRPFSSEWPLRLGPRHCGKSCVHALAVSSRQTAAETRTAHRLLLRMVASLLPNAIDQTGTPGKTEGGASRDDAAPRLP